MVSQLWKIAFSIIASAICFSFIVHSCAIAGTRQSDDAKRSQAGTASQGASSPVREGGRPALPSVYLETDYAPPTGKVIAVQSGQNLQAALNSAAPGDVITLEAGATFTGNFTLPNKTSNRSPERAQPSDWIIIRSSAPDAKLPPPGERVTPSSAAIMPKIVSPNPMPALNAAPGAGYYRLIGLEITIAPDVMLNYGLVKLGEGKEKDIEELPHHIIIDRCFIHGRPIADVRRGIALNSASAAVIDSHISGCHQIGADTQAIGGWSGPGPFKIVNNYLEAAGENLMFGGADPKIKDIVPSDIEIRRNHFFKPLSWKESILSKPEGLSITATRSAGSPLAPGITYYYAVAGRGRVGYKKMAISAPSEEVSFTPKDGQSAALLKWNPVDHVTEYRVYRTTDSPGSKKREWVHYTTAETTFTDGSNAGNGVAGEKLPKTGTRWTVKNLFELKNARRVLIENNILENCWTDAQTGYALVIKSSNQGGAAPWSVTEDVTFRNNVVRNVITGISILRQPGRHPSGDTNTILIQNNLFEEISGDFLKVIDGPINVFVDHNTVFQRGKIITAGGRPASGFAFTNNIVSHNKYGVKGDGEGVGNDTLAKYFPDIIFKKNIIIGGKESNYPPENFFPDNLSEVGLNEKAKGFYALSADSPYKGAGLDGKDIGAHRNDDR